IGGLRGESGYLRSMCAVCFTSLQVVPVAGIVGRAVFVARGGGWRRARPAEQQAADVVEYAACASTSDQTTPASS
ncbi:MAG: hypothetical protein ABIM89_16500, partial [Mycobacteriales bacterium]